jgi:hypothetical protein
LRATSRLRLLAAGTAAATAALTVGALATTASAAPRVAHATPTLHVIEYTPAHPAVHMRAALRTADSTPALPTWTTTESYWKHTYPVTMVGSNPMVAEGANQMTHVKVLIVPITLKMRHGIHFSPSKVNGCTPVSPVKATVASPVFKSINWTSGPTNLGSGDLTTAFQRANFWKYTNPTTGVNPGYGIQLDPTVAAGMTISVPPTQGGYFGTVARCDQLALVNINWLYATMVNKIAPANAAQLGPNVLLLPLLHNVVEYIGDPSNCCVLGFHSFFNTAKGMQTYAISDYDTSGLFQGDGPGAFDNVYVMSHEIGEWLDDPYGNNPTPRWGDTGQVSACQSNLEVGDPLTGTLFTETSGGMTYDFQDLTNYSWFFRQTPSIAANGYYSFQGTFTSPSTQCTPSS